MENLFGELKHCFEQLTITSHCVSKCCISRKDVYEELCGHKHKTHDVHKHKYHDDKKQRLLHTNNAQNI